MKGRAKLHRDFQGPFADWPTTAGTTNEAWTRNRLAAIPYTRSAVTEVLGCCSQRGAWPGVQLLEQCLRNTRLLEEFRDSGVLPQEAARARLEAMARLFGRIDQLVRVAGVDLVITQLYGPLEPAAEGQDPVLAHIAQLYARMDEAWEQVRHHPDAFRPRTGPPARTATPEPAAGPHPLLVEALQSLTRAAHHSLEPSPQPPPCP